MATFPNSVEVTPIGFPGECAGARKPGSSKGYIITTNGNAAPLGNGAMIGNFVYGVAGTDNQCVQQNTAATGPFVTGGNAPDTVANIVAYATPSFQITINGTNYTVSPSFNAGTDTTYAAIATKVQTALNTALAASGISGATVTYAGTAFSINTNQLGAGYTITLPTTTQLSTGMSLTTATGATVTQGTSGLRLLGLVTRANTYVGYDMGAIFYNPGYAAIVPAGQNADVAFRGSWKVAITAFINGGVTAPQYATVYSRDTDGAVFVGAVNGPQVAGYTRTNFVTESLPAQNVVGGIIRIVNDETVGV